MDLARQIEDNRRALLDDLDRRIEAALRPFVDALDWFLATLFRGILPVDWRQQWHDFVIDQAAQEFFVEPVSVRELEEWIEHWAGFCGLLPAAESPVVRSVFDRKRLVGSWAAGSGLVEQSVVADLDSEDLTRAATSQHPASQRPRSSGRPTQTGIRQEFFDQKLAEAQLYLDEMRRRLETLGGRLDAAQLGEAVDVDMEAELIEELIWLYNDALESARANWLQNDLSGDANAGLLVMLSPASLGLPFFTDDRQAERARKQLLRISERLHGRNVVMDRVIFGMEKVETAGTLAGLGVGGNILFTAVKKGGKWAVVKVLAGAAVGMTAEQAAEQGLRAIGAGEQTIRGLRLAAAVITLILLRRRSRGSSAERQPSAAPEGPVTDANPNRRPTRTQPEKNTSSVPKSAESRKGSEGRPTREPDSHEPAFDETPPGATPKPRPGKSPPETSADPGSSQRRKPEVAPTETARPETRPRGAHPDTSEGLAQPESGSADCGVWKLGPVTRGELIHERLGQNLPRSFPVVDIFKDGIVTSIKSIDLQAPSYRNPAAITRLGQGFVDKVAGFRKAWRAGARITESEIKGRILDIVVPSGATAQQQQALDSLTLYGNTRGVKVRILEMER